MSGFIKIKDYAENQNDKTMTQYVLNFHFNFDEKFVSKYIFSVSHLTFLSMSIKPSINTNYWGNVYQINNFIPIVILHKNEDSKSKIRIEMLDRNTIKKVIPLFMSVCL